MNNPPTKETEAGGSVYRRLDKALSAVEDVAALVAALALTAVVTIITFDAFLRYFLNQPIAFQYTLTEEYLLVMIVSLSLSWGFRTGGYIRIKGVATKLPERAAYYLLRAGLLASTIYVATLAWKSGQFFLKLLATGEAGLGAIQLPVWVSWVWVPLGLGILSLRLVLTTFGPAELLEAEHEPDEEI